jgi:putative flippase GtrA
MVRGVLDPLAPGIRQFAGRVLRYGIVGLVVSIVYSLAIMLLVAQFRMRNATEASAIALAVVLPLAYFAHRHVTFFDAAHDPFQPMRFAVTAVSSFVVAIGGMYIITGMLGRSYLIGIALNWALIPAINFLVYLLWVFRLENRRRGGIPA